MPLARDQGLHHDLATRRRHVRHHLRDPEHIPAIEPGREALLLLATVIWLDLLLLLLDQRRDHDVVGAEETHLLENLLLRARADREHRDDGRDAEENA